MAGPKSALAPIVTLSRSAYCCYGEHKARLAEPAAGVTSASAPSHIWQHRQQQHGGRKRRIASLSPPAAMEFMLLGCTCDQCRLFFVPGFSRALLAAAVDQKASSRLSGGGGGGGNSRRCLLLHSMTPPALTQKRRKVRYPMASRAPPACSSRSASFALLDSLPS